MHRLAIIVLTYDRPNLLQQTIYDLRYTDLPQNWELDITLVDNSETSESRATVDELLAAGMIQHLIRNNCNIGIAAGWNVGYAVACAENHYAGIPVKPKIVALVQDDVRLCSNWFIECFVALEQHQDLVLVSGYNSPSHPTIERRGNLYVKEHLPGVHLVARTLFWDNVFPIRVIAHHMDEDWWFTKNAPLCPARMGKICGVVPGLVEHVGAGQSKWNPVAHPEYRDQVKELL